MPSPVRSCETNDSVYFKTPLIVAATEAASSATIKVLTIKVLLRYGANPNRRADANGKNLTPLMGERTYSSKGL